MSNVATREARVADSERTEMEMREERSCCSAGFEDGRGHQGTQPAWRSWESQGNDFLPRDPRRNPGLLKF